MNEIQPRARWEMADVIGKFGDSYQKSRHLPLNHLMVMGHIADCRTSALGGHMERCDSCTYERPVYNSCRDRHCPKCQTMVKEKWLEARRADLLPVEYFHQVFTLPHDLNDLTLMNKKVMLDLLFKGASKTLLQFGEDPRSRLSGKIGFTMVLHTWNQQLLDHFHLHCVIPAGALSTDGRWISTKNRDFLFPVKALAKVFRGKYIDLLRQAYNDNKLTLGGKLSEFRDPVFFENFLADLSSKNWVVYSKAPFGGAERVLNYLGRYTHRIAISNNRICDISDSTVSFTYRDRAANKVKTSTIPGEEFLRRFLLHILPKGFVRIRHYGILAGRNKKEALEKCRMSLGAQPPKNRAENLSAIEVMKEIVGIDVLECPCCKKGRMIRLAEIRPFIDTS